MKHTEILSTAILFLLAGAIAPAYAQGQHEQEKQPEQKQAQQAKPAKQQPQAKPAPQQVKQQPQAKPAQQQAKQQPQAKQAKPAQQQAKQQPQAKPAQQRAKQQTQAKPAQQQAKQQSQAKPAQQQAKQQSQAKPAQHQASRAQASAGHGSIPAARFRASFGSGHTFHVNRSEFTGGSGRFQYGGFWFAMVNPWPVAWLYTDNVYIDYLNGGYVLCDPVHPGVYLSVNIG